MLHALPKITQSIINNIIILLKNDYKKLYIHNLYNLVILRLKCDVFVIPYIFIEVFVSINY